MLNKLLSDILLLDMPMLIIDIIFFKNSEKSILIEIVFLLHTDLLCKYSI